MLQQFRFDGLQNYFSFVLHIICCIGSFGSRGALKQHVLCDDRLGRNMCFMLAQ